MSLDLPWLVLTYAGLLFAAALEGIRPVAAAEARAIGRAAWCAGWVAASGGCLLLTVRGRWPFVDFAGAIAPVAWMVVAALLAGAPGRARWSRAATWIGTIALVAGLSWWRRGFDRGVVAAAAMAFGAFVHRAIERRIWVGFKLASYWASFVGTSAILIPLALAARDHGERVIPTPLGLGLALAMAVAATPLAVAATRAFFAAGGTPEPLEPPGRLCTTGIYRRLRHPIQLAEILFVAAGATATGTRSPLIFLAVFTLALVGPVRFVEERRLAARFGSSFEGYRRRVAGYLPVSQTRLNER